MRRGIVGVLRAKRDAPSGAMAEGIGYVPAFAVHEKCASS